MPSYLSRELQDISYNFLIADWKQLSIPFSILPFRATSLSWPPAALSQLPAAVQGMTGLERAAEIKPSGSLALGKGDSDDTGFDWLDLNKGNINLPNQINCFKLSFNKGIVKVLVLK